MEGEKKEYRVVITQSAYNSFFEIIEYLYDHYSESRAEQISNEINSLVNSLKHYPERGVIEPRLRDRFLKHRVILFKRSSRADVKIIYNIQEATGTIYVTDFFPTEKDDQKISE